MKTNKTIALTCILILWNIAKAQQDPTGPTVSNSSGTSTLAGHAWYRGGNFSGGVGGFKNIFGTMWNSPIHTYTNSVQRSSLNGTRTAAINGSVVNTNGYMGLGNFSTNSPLPNNITGPWTLLHLYGPNNHLTGFFGSGYRTWMQTGMSVYENSDHIYIGMKDEKPLTGSNNFSDAVMAWGDDEGLAPDDMRFIFTAAAPAAGSCTNCPTNATGFNGREI
ncbi:MAG TPA: hypothetical protein VD905_08605, partial [Flavobacteriales bacterium]|nr:hypothetical protein [Flavobacteriales bacterium]